MVIETLSFQRIRAESSTQSRSELNHKTIDEYAEAYKDGASLPPLTVFLDQAGFYWLADGFHRYMAGMKLKFKEIRCDVRTGEHRDAILFSLGANHAHGLRRTNEDKRRAVETMLKDPIWSTWSARKIADACAVSSRFVDHMIEESQPKNTDDKRPAGANRSHLKSATDCRKTETGNGNSGANGSHLTDSKPTTKTGKDGKQYPATKQKHQAVKEVANHPDAITVIVEGSKIRIPDCLKEVFSASKQFDEFEGIQRTISNMFDGLCKHPAGAVVRKDFKNTRHEGEEPKYKAVDAWSFFSRIKKSEPYSPCPHCLGSKCEECGKEGWLTKEKWHSNWILPSTKALCEQMLAELKA